MKGQVARASVSNERNHATCFEFEELEIFVHHAQLGFLPNLKILTMDSTIIQGKSNKSMSIIQQVHCLHIEGSCGEKSGLVGFFHFLHMLPWDDIVKI